jgi:hypothetical protein
VRGGGGGARHLVTCGLRSDASGEACMPISSSIKYIHRRYPSADAICRETWRGRRGLSLVFFFGSFFSYPLKIALARGMEACRAEGRRGR